jgi:predicted AAA+ superfamily ATPase
MLHLRSRQILPRLLKRIQYFPVVAIQGARQTGKSVLARELLKTRLKSCKYVSFDQQTMRARASDHPHTFLAEHFEAAPLIIDEAQKVPAIFDAVKYEVDQKRRPGRYVLLGSTEFSHLTKVRESLTGRMGRVRIFPLNLAESFGDHFKNRPMRGQVMTYLKTGGMPAIFAICDEEARIAQFEDWVTLTCSRDIIQFKTLKLDPEIAFNVLVQTAKLEEPTQAAIARALKIDGRRVGTHLKALCGLFVIQKISPHISSKGKAIYLPLDSGIGGYLGASFERQLQIFVMNERLCKNAYKNEKAKTACFYRSTGRNFIHWVEAPLGEPPLAIQCMTREQIKKTDAELMRAFLAKNKNARGFILAPIPEPMRVNGILFKPWEDVLD